MKVYFARHGETDWNVRHLLQGSSETDLNDNGVEQAHQLGRSLEGTGIVRVYTSQMRRANHTGSIVAEHLGVPCEARPGLQEIGLGDWEGLNWQQVKERWPKEYGEWQRHRRDVRALNGESYDDVLSRMVPAVLKIVSEEQGDVLIVSHGGCLVSFQADFYRASFETMHLSYTVPNAGCFVLESGDILKRWSETK